MPGNRCAGTPETGEYEQAFQHFSAGRLAQAAGVCRAILDVTPHYAPALHLLGIIIAEQGQPAEGLRLVEQALAQEHQNAALHFSRGQILMRLGNNATAVEAFKQSAYLNSDDPRPHQHLVLALLANHSFRFR